MQEQVYIHLQRPFEKLHGLCIVELGLEEIVESHLSVCPRYHQVSGTAIDGEYPNFI